MLALILSGCDGVAKLDVARLHGRAGWQLPDRVVAALDLQPGDRVADIGAGEGYFLPHLVEAVGPGGRVYAVELEPETIQDLEALVARRGWGNVEVVRAQAEDPALPDRGIDLVFLCNTYHHIDDRPDYFAGVRRDLSERGRVAIVDHDAELRGILRIFLTGGHATAAEDLAREMGNAGYIRSDRFEFLPTQLFEVYRPGEGT
jgi:ubiquinone/menaquinone biosynthesis C-methylase UbiE